MTKRNFLIQLFQKLEPYRSLVSAFLVILKNPDCLPAEIEHIYLLFDQYIQGLTDSVIKEKLTKISLFLKTIQEEEIISKKKDEEEAEQLLLDLESL